MATPSGTIWMEWGKGQGMNPRKGVSEGHEPFSTLGPLWVLEMQQ